MTPKTALSLTLLAACSPTLLAQQTQARQDKNVHLNQIQVIGSHNSYHAGFAPSERKYMEKVAPNALRSLDYKHAPLPDQLSSGVRQIEIDIFRDEKGGKFAHPKITQKVAAAGLPADPTYDPNHEMDKPGFKVLHMQDLDQRVTCYTFVSCLTQVRSWSKAHPRALPIFILVETKEGGIKEVPDAVVAEPFTPAAFDAMDTEIRSVFKPGEMITPDDVRGHFPTLKAAIKAGNWPTLDKARGKVIFLLDQHKAGPIYAEGHPSLKGRVIFTNSDPGLPETAFVEQNDGSKQTIDTLVREGYLVRTRSDESTKAARTNDTARRDLTLSSGAQMISTDYPPAEPSQWSAYVVRFPESQVARCNPINKPAGCVDDLLDGTIKH